MTELSPQAQAVMDAVCNNTEPDCDTQHIIAAALRAAADQVAPDDAVEPRNNLPMAIECQRIRRDILAIAAELEGGNV
jgi:hypothetical protein